MVVANAFEEMIARKYGRSRAGMRLAEKFLRIEAHHAIVVRLRPGHRERIAARLTGGKCVQHSGNFQRNSRAHQDVSDSRQHRAIERSQQRELQLLHAVHAHRIRMAFPRQRHLNKVGDDRQFRSLRAS